MKITLAGNSKFTHNQCVCESNSELGCGITALNSILIFVGNTSFHQNTITSSSCAGAIWASASKLYFTGTNNFTGNSARNGGAIYAETHTSLSFNGISNFNKNSAHHQGGAIYAGINNILTFNGTNNFISNSAEFDGGVICALYTKTLSFSGTSNFKHNSAGYRNCVNKCYSGRGGAIYTQETAITFNGANNFINNSAEAEGGVIHKSHGTLRFTGTSSFSHNSAAQGGGAIYTEYSTITFKGKNKFTGNSARKGGALLTRYNGVLTFNGISNFFNNSAKSGGVVYASARVRKHILLSFFSVLVVLLITQLVLKVVQSTHIVMLSCTGTNNFIGNCVKIGGGGGAISTTQNISLIFKLINNFVNNSADNGGAIYGEQNTSLSSSGTSS